jgi:hypothetical protein
VYMDTLYKITVYTKFVHLDTSNELDLSCLPLDAAHLNKRARIPLTAIYSHLAIEKAYIPLGLDACSPCNQGRIYQHRRGFRQPTLQQPAHLETDLSLTATGISQIQLITVVS